MSAEDQTKNQRDLTVQSVISIVFGLSAFLTFCTLRPRWTTLYAARKRQKNAASRLPELPDTFFGWIPTLYKITEEEVLASAGLDAFVFLSFFKMAIKFLVVTLFFALVVLLPVHWHYTGEPGFITPPSSNNGTNSTSNILNTHHFKYYTSFDDHPSSLRITANVAKNGSGYYLWMYPIFVYLFSSLALYLIVTETKRIIGIRQKFLGTQNTITDRTIRLSGIPSELRSEEKIKETIEHLEIGKVESVTLCKDWKEVDDLMIERMSLLRKLEESWTIHLGKRRVERNLETLPVTQPPPPGPAVDREDEDENAGLLNGDDYEQSHVTPYARDRPTTRIWYGFLNLQSRHVDAIDYHEEKLRKLDEKIKSSRKKVFMPMPFAFVTLDSTAACQMAVQATMDPEPMQLLAKTAPAPSDVIWQNTYLSRSSRMLRAWLITMIIIVLTVFWSVLLVPLAGLLSLESIGKVWPQLEGVLRRHDITKTLVQTGLPTLLISLLNLAVPYIYYWLSTLQGMVSQSEVELSLISKNFFFTFFNLFVIFTIFGTASKAASEIFNRIGDSLKDTTKIAFLLAQSLQNLSSFYVNLVILQGLGLFPFRLLEFGSVAMYPINLLGSKTPRDYAELVQPPIFSYGFYLPQTILIFIICTVYSVLPGSWIMLFFGLVYFLIGNFIYKYQLLYAMDHRRHSTGRAWSLICNRLVVGLVAFQLAMIGVLALQKAVIQAVLVVPLLFGTIWFGVFYQRTYEPLMKYIALRTLLQQSGNAAPQGESRYDSETNRGEAVDESEETGLRYVNPSLFVPLEEVWIANKRSNGSTGARHEGGDEDV